MRVAGAVAETLAAHGVSCLFGVLGDGNLPILDALVHEHGADYVAAAREDGAVLMADGYARAGGRLGVATVTHGPALTNAVTALTEAARAGTPLLLVAADTPPGDLRNPQAIDQEDVVRPTGAGFQQAHSAASAAADTALAIRRAYTERRPIVLNIPTPLLGLEAGELPGTFRQDAPPAPAPRAEEVARVAGALAAAERPVIVAGRGAAGARAELVALGERTGALLATTLKAKGFFAGEPYDVGVCGGFATRIGRELIRGSDLLLAVGAGLNAFTTDGGRMLAGRPVIVHNDVRPEAFDVWTPADLRILGDAGAFAAMLAGAAGPKTGWRTEETARWLAASGYATEHPDGSDETGLDPHTVVAALERMVPRRRTLVVEGGHAALSEPCRGLSVPDPSGFVFPVNFGSIGLGLASAIGAATARPDRVTLAVTGDGALMMSLAELDTAVRRGLRLVVVVMNDGAFGYEYHNMLHRGMDVGLSLIPRPDFAALARAFGAEAVTVRTPAELDALEELVSDPSGPVLVDARLTRAVRTRWFAEHENGLDPADPDFDPRYR
ncbi:thiamine pyrophosphate-binding protein [Actinomadura viridis]|uniref:Thiamine pyrophosphate-dependent acetolactate synthase large subunit-like protein n=1 Tax=Actinomadura viridis TaxID=58110 RepID=A0A931DHC5_9ACTN|nr:thiamine pyrophosphate-binding protein [Actinomadura viridis]MBG6088633.1 thiamine pyrophosphate-dependent acetolactate synthase large subunit-like protein [Actinomadura viridis]